MTVMKGMCSTYNAMIMYSI